MEQQDPAPQLRIDAAGTVPHATIRAFEAWKGHGCAPSTHRGYVRMAQQVFAEGVARFGLWPQSTLAEAVQQLRGSRMDTNGFFKASLRKLILFLEQERGNQAVAAEATQRVAVRPSGSSSDDEGSDGGSRQIVVKRLVKKPRAAAASVAAAMSHGCRHVAATRPRLSPKPPTADRLMPLMEDLLRWVASQEEAAPFRAPVSELYTPAQVPGYDSRVKYPMDLRTVGEKLARQEYRKAGVERFRADVCLCFHNCIAYVPNPADPYFQRAVSLLKRFGLRFAERMSELRVTAEGGQPIDEEGRRQPASHEQRRVLRRAARRGGGVLLPFIALSEYYHTDTRLVRLRLHSSAACSAAVRVVGF
jgi:hypothetical protein